MGTSLALGGQRRGYGAYSDFGLAGERTSQVSR
jgi:hypothetical protein